MKRKEMIKQVREIMDTVGNKYNIIQSPFKINLQVNGYDMVVIDEQIRYCFGIEEEKYNFFLDNKQREDLYKVLSEYAFTPIEEREEEPQYQYFIHTIQGMNMSEYTRTHLCLNYDITTKEWCFTDDYNSEDYQTIFTDEELKKLGLDPQELREKYDWARVN